MKFKEENIQENQLRIFEDKSEYHTDNGIVEIFPEGALSLEAKKRLKHVKEVLSNEYLDSLIDALRKGNAKIDVSKISHTAQKSLSELVDALTSEVGRALIGLSVMQLCIKSIAPEQNIRLHKGSSNSASFSWTEGISMRTLDKNFVTPVLRKNDLLRLNADGFMMTRSLAENYPYTFLYKAKLRGARNQWLALVEEIEKNNTNSYESLKFLLSKLLNAADEFNHAAENLLETLKSKIFYFSNRKNVLSFIIAHSESSDYAARLLEVSMHALMQAGISTGAYGDCTLKPLSQMRSANKKHGNIGDIELLENEDIIVSWDAKYGKSYLREEIEEAVEKLKNHNHIKQVGFVTNVNIIRNDEIDDRIKDIYSLYNVSFLILRFESWVDMIYDTCTQDGFTDETQFSHSWISIYCEYLCLKRRHEAPIDEPCLNWVNSLNDMLKKI